MPSLGSVSLTSSREQWDWDLPDPPPRRALPDPEPQFSFGKIALFTVLGTLVPGLGLLLARKRVIGGVIMAVFLTSLILLGLWVARDAAGAASLVVRPAMLNTLSTVLVVVGVLWVGVVVATYLALRGAVTGLQRLLGGVLVGALAFAVAAPMAVGARYSLDQASLVDNVFKSSSETKSATRPSLNPTQPNGQPAPDPWETKPRLNILLLGGDAGKGRTGTRTDTVILASIDTRTGNTTMFSLPRNTARMPFPKSSPLYRYYPDGFYNGDSQDPEHFLNSMYDNVPSNVPKDVLGPTDNLGADALKLSVGEALGLQVDYYVMVNLRGFETLVNALGGVTVNVNSYVPIGGVSEENRNIPPDGYIEPGPNKHLDGQLALWFARGRYGSDDFARMGRQRCVINAIIQQANPANMLARYEQIAKAGKQIVITDIPQEVLPLLVQLSLRVKDGQVRSVLFERGTANFRSFDPDFPEMRKRVKEAIQENDRTASTAKPSTPAPDAPSPSPTAKKKKKPTAPSTSPATPSATPKSDPLSDTCAFDPEAAAAATRPT